MTFDPLYNDDQRSAIYELKAEGLSGRQVAELCAKGVKGIVPFEVPVQTVNRIYRDELAAREELEDSPLADKNAAEAADAIIRRAITVCDRELARFERESRKRKHGRRFDAKGFGALTVAIERLHRMAKGQKQDPRPTKHEEARETGEDGFLAGLAAEDG